MKIKILGATTRAKRSNAGWQSAPSTLLLTMQGGDAKLLLKVFDSEENFNNDYEAGHAEFRLKKDEAIALIEGLTKIYDLNQNQLSVRERLTTPYPLDIAGAMLGKSL
jgi:hypothetical protein